MDEMRCLHSIAGRPPKECGAAVRSDRASEGPPSQASGRLRTFARRPPTVFALPARDTDPDWKLCLCSRVCGRLDSTRHAEALGDNAPGVLEFILIDCSEESRSAKGWCPFALIHGAALLESYRREATRECLTR